MLATGVINYCPYCGKSYYRVDYQTSTCLYCPPVFLNGRLVSKDMNEVTNNCTCLNCGRTFTTSTTSTEDAGSLPR